MAVAKFKAGFSVFLFLFIYLFILGLDSKGSKEPWGLTAIRTSLYFFSHKTILEAKRTTKMNGSRFFQSDCTVRFGIQNLGDNIK